MEDYVKVIAEITKQYQAGLLTYFEAMNKISDALTSAGWIVD